MKQLAAAIFALGLLEPATAMGQATAEVTTVADPCATAAACRKVGTVSVPIGGGRMMKVPVNQTVPWVADDNAIIFPGEVLIISLADEGTGPLPVTLVAAGGEAATRPLASGEMRFAFTASEGGMMLRVESRHKRALHYMAVMVPPTGEPRKTSVCPVQSGLSVYESWPNPIVQLALTNFMPLKKGDLTCR